MATTAALCSSALTAAPRDPLCAPLKHFVASVKPRETRKLEFHTSWGQGFKDDPHYSFYAKRCDHEGYAPAKAFCDALLEHGSAEFAGANALRVMACLSPGLRLDPRADLSRIEMTLAYGGDGRGSEVAIRLDHDEKLGGEVLGIEASGY